MQLATQTREVIMKMLANLLLVTTTLSISTAGFPIEDDVASVTTSAIALSVVKLYRAHVPEAKTCSGILVERQWVLAVAHCGDGVSNRTDNRDATLELDPGDRPLARFSTQGAYSNIEADEDIRIDRVVRVDGAATEDNSVVLLHLESPAPAWSQPVPLHRGELPGSDEEIEMFVYDGSHTRKGGTVRINRKEWIASDSFWALRLEAHPSSIQHGDSGGPLLVTRGGQKSVAGVNWNTGGESGGSAAATFDIDSDGHWNPVGSLIERIVFPAAIIPDGIYEVKAAHSNKCLDVRQSSRADGARVIQFNCTNATNQQWRFVRQGDYYGISAVHSRKCLDVPGSSQMNPGLIQYGCRNTTNQRWRLTRTAGNAYEMQARHSAKCVDVPRSTMVNGANVIQYKCTRALNQRWILTFKHD